MHKDKIVSAIIPARDEAQSIGKVVAELFALKNPAGSGIYDHVVVCDNGSSDGTADIAKAAGAIVVSQSTLGYGIACLSALAVMPQSDIVVFIDGDHCFYAEQSLPMLDAIAAGSDLVIGSRSLGKATRGALTVPQRFGNQLATMLINLLWRQRITDLGPFRAVSAQALASIDMQDRAFGWTVEMQVKAIQLQLNILELPVDTRNRIGVSKISGTVRGVIGAAIGIFSTIFKLWYREHFSRNLSDQKDSV